MAQNKIYKFKDIVEAQAFLNGGVFGSPVFQPPVPMVRDIVGKTFITKAPGPAGTCTFVPAGTFPDGDRSALLFKDIKAQIEAAIANITVHLIDGKMYVVETSPTNGTAIDKTGTSNKLLGFDSAVDTVGKLYKPANTVTMPATPPVWVSSQVTETAHIIYTWE